MTTMEVEDKLSRNSGSYDINEVCGLVCFHLRENGVEGGRPAGSGRGEFSRL